MSGEWSGGAANYTWHRGHQRDGSETSAIRRVLDEFRRAKGWQPGQVWNPRTGAYETPASAEEHT